MLLMSKCEQLIHVFIVLFAAVTAVTACSAMNIMNFTQSVVQVPVTAGDTICLACLFDGMSPQPGTTWQINNADIANNDPFAQVNVNGTLLIRIPVTISGSVPVSCQRSGNITVSFSINLFSESHYIL